MERDMSKIGLLARIEAKPEFADEVEALLRGALELARAEEPTVTWFAFKESTTVFGIFDTFRDEEGRAAHLNGKIAAALMEIAPTKLAVAPDIRTIDLLAVKLP
jgi:quinol monooxygenase YgiN